MHAQKLEGSIQARRIPDLFGHGLLYFSSGFPRELVDGIFENVLQVHSFASPGFLPKSGSEPVHGMPFPSPAREQVL
jgi:hypothetical protein